MCLSRTQPTQSSKGSSASRVHSLLHTHSMSIPVTACTKPKEALLLFKSQRHDDLPELNNDWVLRVVAPIILSSFLQLCKIQMGQPAHQQLQFFILEQTKCQTSTHLHVHAINHKKCVRLGCRISPGTLTKPTEALCRRCADCVAFLKIARCYMSMTDFARPQHIYQVQDQHCIATCCAAMLCGAMVSFN